MKNKSLLSHRKEEPESGVLYLVGTPIGNLSDISKRALSILDNVDLIACEDTRNTKKLLVQFGINNTLICFNQHNSFKKIPKILSYLKAGKSIALVSDAGMPAICDPGEELVKSLKSNNVNVICVPGPSAVLTALISSGMPTSKFSFEGFLPKKKADRKKIFFEISKNEKTTIIFESPHRIKKLLFELKDFFGGNKEIFVGRELTKKFEEHIGPTVDKAIEHFGDKDVLGEFTIVIKGVRNDKNEYFDKVLLKKEIHDLVNAGLSLSVAAKYLAKRENITKNIVYNLY